MRRPDPGRAPRLVGWGTALIAVLLVAAAVPGTSSAFTAAITNSVNDAASKKVFTCADVFHADRRRASAYFEFALSEPADATVAADSGDASNTGTYQGSHGDAGVSEKASGEQVACPNDGGGVYLLDGATSRVTTSKQFSAITGNFSEAVWFRTSKPGKILGFELGPTDDRSSNYDKHLYIGNSGELVYGIYNGTVQTLRSPGPLMDGAWHYAVATTSDAGSRLYVDGAQVDSDPNYVTAEGFNGYWRIGWGNLDSWPDAPGGSNWFSGAIRFAAVYPYVLTAGEVASAWSIGKPGTVKRAEPDPTATATATAVPEASPSATPAATETPAPAETAAPAPSSVKTAGTPIYQPVPEETQVTTDG